MACNKEKILCRTSLPGELILPNYGRGVPKLAKLGEDSITI
jgi:hypothetical protein